MEQREPFIKLSGGNANGYSVSCEVNTKAYRDSFDKMPVSKAVSQSIYREAGRILEKADGHNVEFQVAISARTGALITDNLSRPGTARRTYFDAEESARLNVCADPIILIHNHPSSLAPSYGDMMTAATKDSVMGSVILGHDGSVWYMAELSQKIADRLRRAYNDAKDELGDRAELIAVDQVVGRAPKLGFTWKKVR